jgi:hypothetical protein
MQAGSLTELISVAQKFRKFISKGLAPYCERAIVRSTCKWPCYPVSCGVRSVISSSYETKS